MTLPPPASVDGVPRVGVSEEGVEGLAEGEQAVVEAPHAEGGRVEEAVPVAGGRQGPEALAGASLGPPV